MPKRAGVGLPQTPKRDGIYLLTKKKYHQKNLDEGLILLKLIYVALIVNTIKLFDA